MKNARFSELKNNKIIEAFNKLLQTGNLKNTCTYCNTDFAQKERAKEYLTGGGVSDRAYCCIPE